MRKINHEIPWPISAALKHPSTADHLHVDLPVAYDLVMEMLHILKKENLITISELV